MDALTSLINGKTKSKEKTRLELAKELSEYLNPKDIVEKKQKLKIKKRLRIAFEIKTATKQQQKKGGLYGKNTF